MSKYIDAGQFRLLLKSRYDALTKQMEECAEKELWSIRHDKKVTLYDVEDTMNALDDFSAVDVQEVRRGQWIDKKYRWIKSISMWWSAAYKCSVCGEAGIKDWNYCPHCGASMVNEFEEPEINPCRGCADYDGQGGCISKGGCGARMVDNEAEED